MSATAKSAQRVILSHEMSFHEAYSHVLSGAVPYEAFEEWDGDRIKRIEAKAKAQAAAPKALSCKVSPKGAVSVYGLNTQWPITLYTGQWDRLFAYVETIKAFIAENKAAVDAQQAFYATPAGKAKVDAEQAAKGAKRKAA
jgi:hypothetical protein